MASGLASFGRLAGRVGPWCTAPSPVGLEDVHPGGMVDNSPAFQRWESGRREPSPEGTAEAVVLSRPFGTNPRDCAYPALNRWAIVMCPSGTGTGLQVPIVTYHSNPGGNKALRCSGCFWRSNVLRLGTTSLRAKLLH